MVMKFYEDPNELNDLYRLFFDDMRVTELK